jgi:sugar phosphate isomerase/epimerase
MMKGTSFFSWFGIPLPFEKRLDLIKKAGFDATGGWLGPEEELIKFGQTERMPGLIREKGLFLDYVHAPDAGCNGLWSDSSWRREEVQKQLREHISYCAKHTIPRLVIHLTASKGDQPENYNDHGLRLMRDLVKSAEDAGVTIAVENTQKPEFVDVIFSEISSPFLGFCYDTSHDFLYSANPGALLSKWGHLLSVTHIGDNDGIVDRHWLPRKGILPWDMVRQHFPVATYEGFLNLEVFPTDQEQKAEEFLADAYRSAEWLSRFLAPKAGI